jgi:hypothetical protein
LASPQEQQKLKTAWPTYNPSAPKPAAASAATAGATGKGAKTGAPTDFITALKASVAAKAAASKPPGSDAAAPATPVASPVASPKTAKAAAPVASPVASPAASKPPGSAAATAAATAAAAAAATAAATAAAAYAAKSNADKKILFEGFHKKLKMGVPQPAVESNMKKAGIPQPDITAFLANPQSFIDTTFPATDAAPASSTPAPVVSTPPSGVAQLFVAFEGLTEIEQCKQIFDAVKCLTAKGYKSVGLAYSANQVQTGNVFTAYSYDTTKSKNSFDIGVAKTIAQIPISGSNQANILASLDSVTDDEFRKVFRIIPLSTMKIPGGGVDVDSLIPGDSAQCIQYVEQFLALPNSIILGWCDPFTKKNLLSLSVLKPTELTDIDKLVDDAYTLNGAVPTDKIQAWFKDPVTKTPFLDKTKSVVYTNPKTGAEYLAKRKKHINIGGEMAETTTNTRTTYIPLYLKTLVGKWNREAQQIVDACQSANPPPTPKPKPVKITTPPKDAAPSTSSSTSSSTPPKDAAPSTDAPAGDITGLYKSDSGTEIEFKITQDKISSGKFIVSLNSSSSEIAGINKGNELSFEITQTEFDNFKDTILDKSSIWKVTINGVPTDVPGKWTSKTTAVLPSDPTTPPKAISPATTDATTGSEINSFLKKTTNTRPSKIMFSTGLNDFTPLDILLQFVDTYDSSKIPQGGDTIFSFGGTKKQLLQIPNYDIPMHPVFFDLFSDMLQLNILPAIFKLGNPIITAMIRNIRNSYQNLKPSDDVSHLAILKAQLNSVVLRLQESDIDSTKFGIDTASPTFYDPANKNSKVVTTGKILYSKKQKQAINYFINYKIIKISRSGKGADLYLVCISCKTRLPDELIEPVFTAGLNVNSYDVKIHGNTGIPKNSIKFIVSQDDFTDFKKSKKMTISVEFDGTPRTKKVIFESGALTWTIDEGPPTEIDLLKCTKLKYFKEKKIEQREFFRSKKDFNERMDEFNLLDNETKECFEPYIKIFSDEDAKRILRLFGEMVNKVLCLVEFITIFAEPPYNESALVKDITDFFNGFNFSKIKIEDFPYPFIHEFLDFLSKFDEKIVALFKEVWSVKYAIQEVDLDKCKYMSLFFGYESFNKGKFLNFIQLSAAIAQLVMRFKLLVDEFNKFNKVKQDANTQKNITSIEVYTKEFNNIFAELQFRNRLSIKPVCENIMLYLNNIVIKDDTPCGQFKKDLTSFIHDIDYRNDKNEIGVTNEVLQTIFDKLIDNFIDFGDCMDDYNKKKIFELLEQVGHKFIFIEPSEDRKRGIQDKIIDAHNSLPAMTKASLTLKASFFLKGTSTDIPTLQGLIGKLDNIFKDCTGNDTLVSHFNKFKDNLNLISVVQADIDNLQVLRDYIDTLHIINCDNYPGTNIKPRVKNKVDRINTILEYLHRIGSSPALPPSSPDSSAPTSPGSSPALPPSSPDSSAPTSPGSSPASPPASPVTSPSPGSSTSSLPDLSAMPPLKLDDTEKALLDAKTKVTAQVTAIEQKLNDIRPMLATLKSTPSVKSRFDKLVDNTDEEKQKINTSTTQELDDIEPFLKNLDKNADILIIDINAAIAAEAEAEVARSKVKGQVTDIQKKITKIVPTLTNLTDKKDFQSRLDDLSAVIEKDKPFIEKSSLADLGEYEKLFTGIDHQVNELMTDIISAEDEEIKKAKKSKKSKTLGILDLSSDNESPPTSFKTDWSALFASTDDPSVTLGGGKKQKRSTKKKQNNNRHNIKKKRSSIKKNKKRIITRNTRRRIFE